MGDVGCGVRGAGAVAAFTAAPARGFAGDDVAVTKP